ncbi:MAG TPA: hypothetical protein EYG74_04710 [Sulfurimonas autotrophica]|nr:hypothetical protein [Sulfurimonas autotrophica]
MKNNIDHTDKKKTVIITPVYKENVSKEEMASIIFAQRNLKSYDKIVVSPQKLSNNDEFITFLERYGYKIVFFKNKYFDGIEGYNQLMLSVDFYKQFVDYEYMLIYQLDALILSDALEQWLNKDLDYIGAPWLSEEKKLKVESVGNGGLSLRRVKIFIDVLQSKDLLFNNDMFISLPARAGVLNLLALRSLGWLNPYLIKLNRRALFLIFFRSNEDLFWSFFAQFFIKDFVVPEVNDALMCDIGLVPYDSSRFYYNLAYPTKLSFYITAGITFLSTDVQEVQKINEKYHFGIVENFQKWHDIFRVLTKEDIEPLKIRIKEYKSKFYWQNIFEIEIFKRLLK